MVFKLSNIFQSLIEYEPTYRLQSWRYRVDYTVYILTDQVRHLFYQAVKKKYFHKLGAQCPYRPCYHANIYLSAITY